MPVSVTEYAPISLHIPKYPWKSCSDYAGALDMPNHLTCLIDWHGSKCRALYGMAVYARFMRSSGYAWIWLNMPQIESIMPNYDLMSLNIPDHCWILLSATTYAWKCLNKLFYVRVLNMSQHLTYLARFWICCDIVIIIVTNVVIRILVWSIFRSRCSATNHFMFFDTS